MLQLSHAVTLHLFVLCCQDLDAYIHRSGRTGRAGRSGVSIMFYKYSQEAELKQVEKVAVSRWEEDQSGTLQMAAARHAGCPLC